ncbi:3-deoxy-D-manno-octulosonic acid transferase [Aquimarina agarilytica]|uniref:3-deoxy-D-manno-octulosonic acid transferase n=1 Tax=Aquimarina agarilytica TaxID=1087449 RepID=UPI001E38AB26|nr:glycosyltransferase N-terminal domain-containing protein [Aquimarina agarilytica]
MKLFVVGRIHSKKTLQTADFSGNDWWWFHCASLGEFEQAVPLIEKIKTDTNKILVTFFSPSGYEIKKKHHLIDRALYLPMDTPQNAKLLVGTVQPKAAFFIKYDFWENYFKALNGVQVPIYIVSSNFRKNQWYFKWYGSFFKKTLKRVTHFFVQNQLSVKVLQSNGFTNVSLSGDTRFDRVHAQLSMDNELDFVKQFKQNRTCVVLGSTWPDCEAAFVKAINTSSDNVCFIIAPHEIKAEKIKDLKKKLKQHVSVLSKGVDPLSKVLIIDAIGYLTKIYSQADIAYVGGAMGTTGMHNILEPAVFGVPILVGPNTQKFPEAKALEKHGGLQVVTNSESFKKVLFGLLANEPLRKKMGEAAKDFVQSQVGATDSIIAGIAYKD